MATKREGSGASTLVDADGSKNERREDHGRGRVHTTLPDVAANGSPLDRAERFEHVINAAPDAILVVDVDGRIEIANAQAERLFGHSRAELVGESFEKLIPERFRLAHGAHVASFFASPTVRPMGAGIELYGRHRDGSDLPIEVSLSPLSEGQRRSVVAIVRDVTERRQARAAIKLGAERLGSAIESFHDAFALFDPAGALVMCNAAYRLLMDEAPRALVGRAYSAIMDDWLARLPLEGSHREEAKRGVLRVWNEPEVAMEIRARDGKTFRVASRRTPEGGIVVTIWDLTEDARREEELHQARIAAEAGSAAKTEFLASMSHELRTPLNAILGFAQLLAQDRREPPSERQRGRIDQIQRGGEHLLRLIDDILDLSRIESGNVSFSAEPVSCVDALRDVLTTLDGAAARNKVTLHLSPPEGELPIVRTDRTRFIQILMNFGTNAIKYNREGGWVRFDVERRDAATLRVWVRDNGIGIPLDKQDRIFQPFQRAGQESGPIEGTGIGLSITKRLAELMGGSVGFQSRPSEGSDFWVDVPIDTALAQNHEVALDNLRAPASTSAPEGASSVLYVEDNPANVLFMRDLFDSFDGIELITAPTAEMGIELARTRRPNVILLDINLPGMSGIDALHVLKSTAETREIPVVALTAAASARDRQKGERAGFYKYLTKPIRIAELEATLEELRVMEVESARK